MEVLSTTERKANKNHTCDFCYLTIQKGERYESQKIANDGTVYEWKSHFDCNRLTKELNMYDNLGFYDEGLTGDDFQEIIMDYLTDNHIQYNGWEDAYKKAKTMLLGEC